MGHPSGEKGEYTRARRWTERAPSRTADPEVDRVRRLARLLDAAFTIPGTQLRIGLDPIIGLVPGLGDVLTSLMGTYALVVAYRLGAPPSILLRLGANLGLDALVGGIPLLGDLFDAGFKANLRNADLLERWLESPHEAKRSSRVVVALVLVAILAVLAAVVYSLWQLGGWLVRSAPRG